MDEDLDRTAWTRRRYDRYAPRYDRDTGYYERFMLADGRTWVCGQAHGRVLEVAVGTGRNLPYYPPGIELTGVDLSPAMLAIARTRVRTLGMTVDLREADAAALPFADAGFDTAVCTLALSSIPDERAALAEMYRVLRPGGALLLLGHVASPYRAVRAVQRLVEHHPLGLVGDHLTRRTVPVVTGTGFVVRHRQTRRAGTIERLAAVKPHG